MRADIITTQKWKSSTDQPVTVTPSELVSIAINPYMGSFADCTTMKFSAIGTYTDGSTQDIINFEIVDCHI